MLVAVDGGRGTEHDPVMSLDTALAEWADWMRAAPLSARTIAERVWLVRLLAVRMDTNPVRCDWRTVTRFLADERFTAGTVQTYQSQLRAWFSWLVRVGARVDDPMLTLPRPRPGRRMPHPIETDELARLLSSSMYRRTRMMILLGAYEGLRAHEIAKTRGEDLGATVLRVLGKGNAAAVVPLHPAVEVEAGGYPARGWWFPSPADRARPVSANSVSATVSAAMRRAGIRGTAHSLRHWYGTTMLRAGANIRVVQENMRHASLASTQIYTKVDDRERAAAVVMLPVPLHSLRSR